MNYSFARTPRLDVAYLEWNPQGERTVVLVHGWPDSPEGWNAVALDLARAGYRVLCPALQCLSGHGTNSFLSANSLPVMVMLNAGW